MVQNSNQVKAKPDMFNENNSSVCEKKEREIKKGWLCIYCPCGKMFFDLASRDSTVDSIIRDFWLLLA